MRSAGEFRPSQESSFLKHSEGARLVSYRAMAYTVFGFRSGTLDSVRLHIKSFEKKADLPPAEWQERMMRAYTVEADGFDFLERRFNVAGIFQNFILLDDVAIEACKEFEIPLGQSLGTIDLIEMGGLANKFFAWAYYSACI